MATAIADGPGGLECTHAIGGVTMNDRTLSHRIKLNRITGLHSLPESDDERRPRTGFLGEATYPGYARGKTVVYEGVVEGSSLDNLRSKCAAFRAGLQNRSDEYLVTITPNASWGDDIWAYYARVMQLDIDDVQADRSPRHARGPYGRGFMLGLRMSDPRFIYVNSSHSTSGHTTSQELTNQGSAPTDPTFTIIVPGGTPDIELTNADVNTSNGTARLRFNNVPTGTLTVNFARRTALLGSADAMAYFDTVYNQWWDELIPGLAPGNNTVNVTGSTSWAIAYSHRSW